MELYHLERARESRKVDPDIRLKATDIYELAQTLESIDPTRALNLYREVLELYKKMQSAELLKEVGERIRQLKRK